MSVKAIYEFGPYGSPEPPRQTGIQLTEEEWDKAVKDGRRSKVIVTDAWVEALLDIAITLRLLPKDEVCGTLLGGRGIRFNDKARLAYLLGLIERGTMEDLFHIHNIRHRFAHTSNPDFSDKVLIAEIQKLSTVGGKKGRITEDNYMDFYDKAVEKWVGAIGGKWAELQVEKKEKTATKKKVLLRRKGKAGTKQSGDTILNSEPK